MVSGIGQWIEPILSLEGPFLGLLEVPCLVPLS